MTEQDRAFVKQAVDTGLGGLSGSPQLADRVTGRAGQSRTMRSTKTRLILVFAFLALAATAFAVGPGAVLKYLFPGDQKVREEAAPYVQKIDITQKSGSTAAVIQDALIQDGSLSVGLILGTRDPVYIVTQSLHVDGKAAEVSNSSIESQWIGEGSAMEVRGFSLNLADMELPDTEKSTVRLTAALLSPAKGIRQVDTESEDSAGVWAQIDRAVAEGFTPVSSYEPHEVLVASAWMKANGFDMALGVQYPVGSAKDLLAYSNMTLVDRLDAAFTLNPALRYGK